MQSSFLLQSVQGGPFNNSSRMIDIDIPAGHIVDMSKSFIQIECSITPNYAYFPTGVSNLVVSNIVSTVTPMNIDLIKNASLTSSTKGKLEDIRRVNVLSHNLLELSKSTSNKMSTIDSLYQVFNYDNKIKLSPFVEFKKTGSINSNYRSVYLRIPMSHLFQLGLDSAFDTNKLGTTRIHLELDNLLNLEVNQVVLSTPLQRIAGPAPSTGPYTIASGSSFTMAYVYDSLDQVPFFVGQSVTLTYTPTGGAVTNEDVTINALSFNEQTGILSVTTSKDFPVVANVTYGSISMKEYEPVGTNADGTFNILTAQLGLTVNNGPSQSSNELQYYTFTTEEYNVGGQNFMNKVFEIEPECINTFLMQYANNSANLLSNGVNIKSYRLRIDGNDVVDRDINVNTLTASNTYLNDPLHYELVNRTFVNASMNLNNLTGVNINTDAQTLTNRFTSPNNQVFVICSPTPITQNSKKYQVNLNSSSAINNVVLFKQVVRSLKL